MTSHVLCVSKGPVGRPMARRAAANQERCRAMEELRRDPVVGRRALDYFPGTSRTSEGKSPLARYSQAIALAGPLG